jgi:hypothetical protein
MRLGNDEPTVDMRKRMNKDMNIDFVKKHTFGA